MQLGLFRLHLSGALQQHASDDLKAVRNPVVQFLKQDFLLPQKVVFQLLGKAGVRDIQDRNQQAYVILVSVIQLLGVDN